MSNMQLGEDTTTMSMTLNPVNEAAFQKAVQSLETLNRAAVFHPTGTGKSCIAWKVVEAHPQTTFFWLVAGAQRLALRQAELTRYNGGTLPGNVRFCDCEKLAAATPEQWVRLGEQKPGCIVLDCYHELSAVCWAQSVQKLLRMCPQAKVLGLGVPNGAPVCAAAQELFADCIVSHMTVAEAMAAGTMPVPSAYAALLWPQEEELATLRARIKNLCMPKGDTSLRVQYEELSWSLRQVENLTVLLKNENQLLPLDTKSLKSIAIIGPNADQVQFGDYTWSRNNKDGVTPLQGIKNRVNKNTAIHYAKGCSLTSLDTSGIAEAVEAAKNSEVAVIFGGSASAALARDYKSSTCGEGFDLNDLNLTGAQSQLIREVYRTGTPVILVLVTGKPFVIEWEKNNLPAILVQWYAGEQAGNSIADILFGKVVPSGRLTFSFPRSTGHLPVYYNYLPSDRGFYKNPGSYDSPGRDYVFSAPSALYSFGYGLSYTSFVYKNLSTDKDKYELNDTIHATVEVKNTGKYTGKEVVQLYVRDKASTYVTPVKQLRDFKKIELAPDETRTIQLQVPISDLYLVDEKNQRFVEAGEFILEVGQASNNIILSKTIVAGEPSTIGNDEIVKPKNKKSSRQMEVKGEVRDVQATLVPDMQIIEKSTGKTIAVTDAKGQFKFTTGNHEYLIFKKSGYQTVEIEVNNMNVINITVNYGEN